MAFTVKSQNVIHPDMPRRTCSVSPRGLAPKIARTQAASRHPARVGSASRPDAAPETTKADIHDETTVAAALFGAYGAINAISLYVERGRETFDAVHVEAAARVARLARESGVERLIDLKYASPIRCV
jgi:hypothetical protein